MELPDGVAIIAHQMFAQDTTGTAEEAVSASIATRVASTQRVDAPSAVQISKPVTVLEVVVSQRFSKTGDWGRRSNREDAFSHAVAMANEWIGALSLALQMPLAKVRVELLPSALPVGIGLFEPWEIRPGKLARLKIDGWMHLRETRPVVSTHPPQPDELDLWIEAALINHAERGPFVRSSELLEEAIRQQKETGEYEIAMILYAASCESAIDELVQHLLWEQQTTPHEASEFFLRSRAKAKKGGTPVPESVVSLMKKKALSLLRGSTFGPSDEPEPFRQWTKFVVEPRNHVIHGGKRVTREEIERCEWAFFVFQDWVKNEVFASRSRFPITTIALLGEAQLVKRGEWERFSPIEQSLSQLRIRLQTFRRWSDMVVSLRSSPTLIGQLVDPEQSVLQVVVSEDGPKESFLVHTGGAVVSRLPPEITHEIGRRVHFRPEAGPVIQLLDYELDFLTGREVWETYRYEMSPKLLLYPSDIGYKNALARFAEDGE
ncbi:hypothetical protein [Corynebacterium sp. MSK008]|uniref:hypothetical protein n=1 Tax=Corynebacterium sp. MSK008 TaxID=3050188 RepID=UPI00254BC2B9|nr:hypothetical protein [Corynebacterium sp. MSK008]MDK8878715.1 hypothetical protein [Corynebacterium sp. MSK008]